MRHELCACVCVLTHALPVSLSRSFLSFTLSLPFYTVYNFLSASWLLHTRASGYRNLNPSKWLTIRYTIIANMIGLVLNTNFSLAHTPIHTYTWKYIHMYGVTLLMASPPHINTQTSVHTRAHINTEKQVYTHTHFCPSLLHSFAIRTWISWRPWLWTWNDAC